MRLIYPKKNISYLLKKNVLNSLVIEKPWLLEQCVVDLYKDVNGISENYRLSENEEPLSVQKNIALIMSPMDFEYDKRELNKKFLSYMKREIDESDLSQRIVQKYAEMKEIIEEIYFLSDVPIEYNALVTENDIFKHFDIHIKPPEGSFVEKVIEYGSVLKRLTEKQIIVLANCEAYMERNDYEFLRKYIESEELYILLLSNRQLSGNLELNMCIIDRDMCEIY